MIRRDLKTRLVPDGCVTRPEAARMLIPPQAELRFFVGLRLALGHDLRF